MAEGGLLESKTCALSRHATLSHNHESQFWKQLFIVCCLFAAATPGYPSYHALCLQVSCSTWKPAETDAVDICHLLRVPVGQVSSDANDEQAASDNPMTEW